MNLPAFVTTLWIGLGAINTLYLLRFLGDRFEMLLHMEMRDDMHLLPLMRILIVATCIVCWPIVHPWDGPDW